MSLATNPITNSSPTPKTLRHQHRNTQNPNSTPTPKTLLRHMDIPGRGVGGRKYTSLTHSFRYFTISRASLTAGAPRDQRCHWCTLLRTALHVCEEACPSLLTTSISESVFMCSLSALKNPVRSAFNSMSRQRSLSCGAYAQAML